MIRKSTWVVLGIFVILAAAALFIQWSPQSPIQTPTTTPLSTAAPYALEGMMSTEVTALTLQNIDGEVNLVRNADQTWTRNGTLIVDAGKVEELLANLYTIRVLTELAPDYALDSLGLVSPTHTILVETPEQTIQITIGGKTPTDTGNYLQIGTQPAIVVSKFAVEAILQAFTNAVPNTPTPETIELTPTP